MEACLPACSLLLLLPGWQGLGGSCQAGRSCLETSPPSTTPHAPEHCTLCAALRPLPVGLAAHRKHHTEMEAAARLAEPPSTHCAAPSACVAALLPLHLQGA